MKPIHRTIIALAVAGGMSVGMLGVAYGGQTDRPGMVKLDDEHFPHMHSALFHLRKARSALDKADPIFAHHRVDALDETDKAIKVILDTFEKNGVKEDALPPSAVKLDEPKVEHGEMHDALSELHDAYKELDEVEPKFDRAQRMEVIDHVEKAIQQCRAGLNEAEK